MPKRTSIIWKCDKIKFRNICKNAQSIAEILRHFYTNHLTSGLYKIVHQRIKEDGIDISHIKLGFSNRKGKQPTTTHTKESFITKFLKRNVTWHSNFKEKIINFNIIPNDKCSVCRLGRLWNDLPLTLQIDHIDGDTTNNMINNLRFICPNCHTQTQTFCRGKNKTKNQKPFICQNCDKSI